MYIPYICLVSDISMELLSMYITSEKGTQSGPHLTCAIIWKQTALWDAPNSRLPSSITIISKLNFTQVLMASHLCVTNQLQSTSWVFLQIATPESQVLIIVLITLPHVITSKMPLCYSYCHTFVQVNIHLFDLEISWLDQLDCGDELVDCHLVRHSILVQLHFGVAECCKCLPRSFWYSTPLPCSETDNSSTWPRLRLRSCRVDSDCDRLRKSESLSRVGLSEGPPGCPVGMGWGGRRTVALLQYTTCICLPYALHMPVIWNIPSFVIW